MPFWWEIGQIVSPKYDQSIVVRGFDSDGKIHLPTVYSRDFIPVNRSHIPTAETVKSE